MPMTRADSYVVEPIVTATLNTYLRSIQVQFDVHVHRQPVTV